MNFQEDNRDWQIQGSSFVSKTLRQLSVFTDRINVFFNLTAKWLNTSLYSKQSQLENEGKNYYWLRSLVNRLEHPSNFFLSGFQRNGYEATRSVKYRWFDPRYWMEPDIPDEINEADSIDTEITPAEVTGKKVRQPLSGIREIQKNTAAMMQKYSRGSNFKFDIIPAGKPELHPVEPLSSIIQTGNDSLMLTANTPVMDIPSIPANVPGNNDFTFPVVPLPVSETEYPSGTAPVLLPAEIQGGEKDVIEKEPGLQEIWNEGPIARKIENSIKQLIKSIYKKESNRIYRSTDDSHRQGSFVTQFLRKFFKNVDNYSEYEEPVLPESQMQEQPILHNKPVISQEKGIFPDIVAESPSEIPAEPGYGLNEFGASIPFEISAESGVNMPFRQFNQPAEPSLPLPVPVMESSSAENSFIPQVAMPALSASGKSSGPVYLAMAPLLRPMPEELRGGEEDTQPASEAQVEQESANEPEYDPEQLAAEVYSIIKRRLLIEQERSRGSF